MTSSNPALPPTGGQSMPILRYSLVLPRQGYNITQARDYAVDSPMADSEQAPTYTRRPFQHHRRSLPRMRRNQNNGGGNYSHYYQHQNRLENQRLANHLRGYDNCRLTLHAVDAMATRRGPRRQMRPRARRAQHGQLAYSARVQGVIVSAPGNGSKGDAGRQQRRRRRRRERQRKTPGAGASGQGEGDGNRGRSGYGHGDSDCPSTFVEAFAQMGVGSSSSGGGGGGGENPLEDDIAMDGEDAMQLSL